MTGLDVLTMLLLTFSFAPWGAWPAAYIALAPWVMALWIGRETKAAVWLGGLTGYVFWAGNLYWLTWITCLGHAAGTFYLALFWLLASWVMLATVRRRWPTWLALPVLWVALEYARTFFIGFPWMFLAHSQYARTSLIQISDLTGQYGVSFVVAMVNGLAVDMALCFRREARGGRRRATVVGAATVAILLTGMLVYGHKRLREQTQSEGPIIALVQQAVPTRLSGPGEPHEVVLNRYVTDTMPLFGMACDLVVWPESVLALANPQMQDLRVDELNHVKLQGLGEMFLPSSLRASEETDEEIRSAIDIVLFFARREFELVSELSARLGCPILAGNSAVRWHEGSGGGEWVIMNDAMLLDGEAQSTDSYSKINLVPFSEYVPFKESWPAFFDLLSYFVPPSRPSLQPGREYKVMRMSRYGREWALATPICYEGTFARVCRRMVAPAGNKTADVMVNISNDGWFVYTTPDGSNRLSVEHAQHLAAYCFRAVENRVPVVRSVNTGISASIDSNGRLIAWLDGKNGMQDGSPMARGVLLLDGGGNESGDIVRHGAKILVDSRVSRYSLIGDLFARLVLASAAIMLVCIRLRHNRRIEGI